MQVIYQQPNVKIYESIKIFSFMFDSLFEGICRTTSARGYNVIANAIKISSLPQQYDVYLKADIDTVLQFA